MIGRVGSILDKASVNAGWMAESRSRAEGLVVMAVTPDAPNSRAAADEIVAIDRLDPRSSRSI